ncbi:alpha-E domain-containing protein [Xinfangfangia sp. CPCC 101601]|uniref:Alpha-E domain-containing protein n=1 Tax=Pseudogemmobacter lacusdianii TaxID=3069608 RepID=A0ABU0VVP4_9RHOB|nr:alpha-E domain-containing protein [Xinfangfangia sp. CPCC 101601]MDQ2065809.1 alpha-E domain-containing protein [Xinfangfangia sp. CPCC 101601]
MLSRTAENLYWIARYMERADTSARLLEVGSRISLLPSAHGYRSEWDSLLQACGMAPGFAAKYGDPVQRNLESWLFFDRDNPSSVASCITAARENGRIVRTALTSQVWDALNTAFQELKRLEREERSSLELSQMTDWVMRHAAMLRGAIDATLLRDDGFNFLNIGYYLERCDNTARLMDVKYYVLLPRVDFVGSGLDNYQWTTLLRAMGAHRAFHWAYGGEVTASKIAHFLILNPQSPRALITCIAGTANHLNRLSKAYGRASQSQAMAAEMLARLEEETVDRIMDEGLHEYLTGCIRETAALGQAVHEDFFSGEAR